MTTSYAGGLHKPLWGVTLKDSFSKYGTFGKNATPVYGVQMPISV